ADNLLLLLEDCLEIERVCPDSGFREHVLRLDERQAERAFDDTLHERRVALDHLLRRRRQARQHLACRRFDLLPVRQLPVDGRPQSTPADPFFPSSGGIFVIGDRISRLFFVFLSSVAASRRRRTTAGSFRNGWKSRSTNSARPSARST